MKYITRLAYSGPDFLGRPIEIPERSAADSQDSMICWNRIPICLINSQIAHKYFAWDEDGQGVLRGQYEGDIWFSKEARPYVFEIETVDEQGQIHKETVIKYSKYSPEEIRYLQRNFSKYLQDSDIIQFNNDFFRAPITDLETMARYLRHRD